MEVVVRGLRGWCFGVGVWCVGGWGWVSFGVGGLGVGLWVRVGCRLGVWVGVSGLGL